MPAGAARKKLKLSFSLIKGQTTATVSIKSWLNLRPLSAKLKLFFTDGRQGVQVN
ncbi:MAG: hypothetical protein MPL62_00750 [Alphaproteobacteria bacterium]|nr:hypothetical protein [Alphaproteobacteria bacterium]